MYRLHKSELFKRHVMNFALDYKKKGGAELANRFLDAVEDALSFIGSNPLVCSIYHEAKLHPLLQRYEFRKWALQRFPHNIYFRLSNDIIRLELIYAQAMDIASRMNDDIVIKNDE